MTRTPHSTSAETARGPHPLQLLLTVVDNTTVNDPTTVQNRLGPTRRLATLAARFRKTQGIFWGEDFMIIWRGWGAIVVAIVFGCSFIANLLSDIFGGMAYWDSHAWPFACALFAAGAIICVTDVILSRKPSRTLLDEKTGERIAVARNHDLFFLRVRWWGLMAVCGGVLVLAFNFTPGQTLRNRQNAQILKNGVRDPQLPQPQQSRAPVGDYAQARRTFRTNLLRKKPSPQPFEKTSVPAGVEQVEYSSGDLRLKAWLARGTGKAERQPAVLFLHGGWSFGEDDWKMAQPFRDAGFSVMVPILRGENGQAGDFSMFYDEVDDVIAAASYFAGRTDVDASHLYLAGHSAGATLTLLAACTSQSFRAAASFSGAPDQKTFLASGWNKVAPFDPAVPKEVEMRSAIVYAESFKCPVRIFCGNREPYFQQENRATAQLAQARGLDVEAISVPGDHYSAVPEEINRAIAFFRATDVLK